MHKGRLNTLITLVVLTMTTHTAGADRHTCQGHLERIARIVKYKATKGSPQEILDRQLRVLAGSLPTTGPDIAQWEIALHLVGESFNDRTLLTMDSKGEALELIHALAVSEDLNPYLKMLAQHVHSAMGTSDKYHLPNPVRDPNTPKHLVSLLVEIDTFTPANLQFAFHALMSTDRATQSAGDTAIAQALKKLSESILTTKTNLEMVEYELARTEQSPSRIKTLARRPVDLQKQLLSGLEAQKKRIADLVEKIKARPQP